MKVSDARNRWNALYSRFDSIFAAGSVIYPSPVIAATIAGRIGSALTWSNR